MFYIAFGRDCAARGSGGIKGSDVGEIGVFEALAD